MAQQTPYGKDISIATTFYVITTIDSPLDYYDYEQNIRKFLDELKKAHVK